MIQSLDWQDHLVKVITVEEYYLYVPSSEYGKMQFKVKYIVHNGYTVIEPIVDYNEKLSDFAEWFKFRSDLNTRYDMPHWYQPIKWNRRKTITKWAMIALRNAFRQYHQENLNAKR